MAVKSVRPPEGSDVRQAVIAEVKPGTKPGGFYDQHEDGIIDVILDRGELEQEATEGGAPLPQKAHRRNAEPKQTGRNTGEKS